MEERIKEYIQDTEIKFIVTNENSMSHIAPEMISIPARIPIDTDVAVCPTKKSTDQYWLANITGILQEDPLVYELHYYNFNKQKKVWIKMKGNGAYGKCPHKAVIMAGINFNKDGSLTAHSKQQLTHVLQQQK